MASTSVTRARGDVETGGGTIGRRGEARWGGMTDSRARRSITTGRGSVRPRASGVGAGKTAVVVGGGVGGLGMASRLAKAGFDVTLLEKNADVGGRCRSEELIGGGEGYRFDTGP